MIIESMLEVISMVSIYQQNSSCAVAWKIIIFYSADDNAIQWFHPIFTRLSITTGFMAATRQQLHIFQPTCHHEHLLHLMIFLEFLQYFYYIPSSCCIFAKKHTHRFQSRYAVLSKNFIVKWKQFSFNIYVEAIMNERMNAAFIYKRNEPLSGYIIYK